MRPTVALKWSLPWIQVVSLPKDYSVGWPTRYCTDVKWMNCKNLSEIQRLLILWLFLHSFGRTYACMESGLAVRAAGRHGRGCRLILKTKMGSWHLDTDKEEQWKGQKWVRAGVLITRAYSYPSSMTSIHRGLKSNGNFISCFPSAAGSYKKETVKTRISRCV